MHADDSAWSCFALRYTKSICTPPPSSFEFWYTKVWGVAHCIAALRPAWLHVSFLILIEFWQHAGRMQAPSYGDACSFSLGPHVAATSEVGADGPDVFVCYLLWATALFISFLSFCISERLQGYTSKSARFAVSAGHSAFIISAQMFMKCVITCTTSYVACSVYCSN